jgi:Uma2 family endonuclease
MATKVANYRRGIFFAPYFLFSKKTCSFVKKYSNMTATAIATAPTFGEQAPNFEPDISLETFLEKYRKGGEDGMKWEWNNGIIEKTTAMKIKEQYIVRNLTRRFHKTTAYREGNELTFEVEVWTTPLKWRKPDGAYLTNQQIVDGANGIESMPLFVIEVISKNDDINIVVNKVDEYFAAGVQVIWHIFPEQKMVHIYRSLDTIEVCRGEKLCSAAPVLLDFDMKVSDIFKV